MRDFVIMTDSCCDLTAELAEELELTVVPLSVLIEEDSFLNYLDGREIGFKEFFDRIRTGAMPTTSAVSVGMFEDTMRSILADGKDILYLGFSSALSTTYQSASIAADGLREEFPEASVCVVDTLCASLGQGLLAYLCAQEKKAGKTLEEVRAFAEETKGKLCHWVTVDDLHHLKRGGRVSAATAAFGTMLNIKPIIHVDDAGRLVSVGKARGRKVSLMTLVDEMEKRAIAPEQQTIFICHGDCEEDAKLVANEVQKRFGVEVRLINYVGPVIGAHTGVGVVALFFLGNER